MTLMILLDVLSVGSRATILELVGGAQVSLMKGATLGPCGRAILVPQAAKGPAVGLFCQPHQVRMLLGIVAVPRNMQNLVRNLLLIVPRMSRMRDTVYVEDERHRPMTDTLLSPSDTGAKPL